MLESRDERVEIGPGQLKGGEAFVVVAERVDDMADELLVALDGATDDATDDAAAGAVDAALPEQAATARATTETNATVRRRYAAALIFSPLPALALT